MIKLGMREIYVDSRRRSDPYGNAYTLFIQNPLKNVTKVELVSATVPNTIYNITNGINIFSLNQTTNCSIANGFYSTTCLIDAVNKSEVGSNLTLAFLCEEGKFIFYGQNEFTLDLFSDEFLNVTGFTSNVLVSNLATTSNGIYSSTYLGKNFVKASSVANFKTCGEYIYLDIDELRRPHSIDAVNNVYNSQSSTIFAIIPLDVSSGCIKTFKELTDYKVAVEYPKPIDQIDRLTIEWKDFKGNTVNFNGVDENALILRFYEEPVHIIPDPVPEKIPVKLSRPDKRTVFVLLLVSLVFILFIKRK
jgi:hypothetical protein